MPGKYVDSVSYAVVERQTLQSNRQKAQQLICIKQLQDKVLVFTDVTRAIGQTHISIS